jgi:hypothetical protein
MGGGHTLFVLLHCYYFSKISLGGSCHTPLPPYANFSLNFMTAELMKKNSDVFAADILQQFFPLIFKVNSSSFDQSRKK